MENTHEQPGKSESITKKSNVDLSQERYEDKNFVDTSKLVWNYSILYDDDISTFQQGTHYSLYKKFGSKQLDCFRQGRLLFLRMGTQCNKTFSDW